MGRMGGGSLKARLLIGVVVAGFALFTYFFASEDENLYTREKEKVAWKEESQEVQFGLTAMKELVPQFGGRSDDVQAQRELEAIGAELIVALEKMTKITDHPYEYSFTLLDDDQTVNAFALPGGPMFVTEALYYKLNRAQLAGVMGHEMGHVIERHSNQRMAKQKLGQGLTGAAVMASGDYNTAQVAGMVNNFIQMKYGREDELESDAWGLDLMVLAGYDPREMIEVMNVLAEASGGSGGQPEWASTHPDPKSRISEIEAWIAKKFPDGVPEGLRR